MRYAVALPDLAISCAAQTHNQRIGPSPVNFTFGSARHLSNIPSAIVKLLSIATTWYDTTIDSRRMEDAKLATEPSDMTLVQRLRRLMDLGGEAAAKDADVWAYETLDVIARTMTNAASYDLYGDIRRWHLAGRPNAEETHRRFNQRVMREFPDADIIDATEDVEERLQELEQLRDRVEDVDGANDDTE